LEPTVSRRLTALRAAEPRESRRLTALRAAEPRESRRLTAQRAAEPRESRRLTAQRAAEPREMAKLGPAPAEPNVLERKFELEGRDRTRIGRISRISADEKMHA